MRNAGIMESESSREASRILLADTHGFRSMTLRILRVRLMASLLLGLCLIHPLVAEEPSQGEAKNQAQATASSGAQPAADNSQVSSDLAKQSQNPIASLISLPFQNNMNFGVGETDRIQNTLNIQPVLPFQLSGSVNFIARTIIPVVRQPIGIDESKNGLGDISFSGFFSPAKPGKLIWGVGPAILLKTATDGALGTGKWSAGPSVVALTMPGPWVIGALFSNVWSFAGDADRGDVNVMTFQYFINYNMKKGWYLSSAPILTSNWEADAGEKWVIPFGGGVGKVFRIGSQPLNGSVQAFWNAKHPEQGASWTLRLQLVFLFPK